MRRGGNFFDWGGVASSLLAELCYVLLEERADAFLGGEGRVVLGFVSVRQLFAQFLIMAEGDQRQFQDDLLAILVVLKPAAVSTSP